VNDAANDIKETIARPAKYRTQQFQDQYAFAPVAQVQNIDAFWLRP